MTREMAFLHRKPKKLENLFSRTFHFFTSSVKRIVPKNPKWPAMLAKRFCSKSREGISVKESDK